MTCNGTLLDKEYVKWLESMGMKRIHISFDGTTKETLEKYRVGAKYEQVLDVCKAIGESKIQLFMNCLPWNQDILDEVEEYPKLAKEVGASGLLFMKFQTDTLNFYEGPLDLSRMVKVREIARELDLIVLGVYSDLPYFQECEDAYVCPYITLGGNVYPCSYMANMRTTEIYYGTEFSVPSPNYIMGNLNENWMGDIWRNEAYRELRDSLKLSRPKTKTLSKEYLSELKNQMENEGRFAYCYSCLCRWGESGL
jgi:MoaA/NifB/PqqE/SkfB family radical SAM enzyme